MTLEKCFRVRCPNGPWTIWRRRGKQEFLATCALVSHAPVDKSRWEWDGTIVNQERAFAIKVYVDDIRQAPEGWTLVRTISEAIRILTTQYVEALSLDHDVMYVKSDGITYAPAEEDFASIAYVVRLLPKPPRTVYVHSANPAAYPKIKAILADMPEIEVIKRFEALK